MVGWEIPYEIEALLYEDSPDTTLPFGQRLEDLSGEQLYLELSNPFGVTAERRRQIEAEFIRRRYERRKAEIAAEEAGLPPQRPRGRPRKSEVDARRGRKSTRPEQHKKAD